MVNTEVFPNPLRRLRGFLPGRRLFCLRVFLLAVSATRLLATSSSADEAIDPGLKLLQAGPAADYFYVGLALPQRGCLILTALIEKSHPVSESSLFWISVKRNNAPDIRGNHDHLGFTGWALNVADHIRRIGQTLQFHAVPSRTEDFTARESV
jgi:hypothetical protein